VLGVEQGELNVDRVVEDCDHTQRSAADSLFGGRE
jgi:hypothetical protein